MLICFRLSLRVVTVKNEIYKLFADSYFKLLIFISYYGPFTCRYLNRTAAHPALREDPEFRQFLETENV